MQAGVAVALVLVDRVAHLAQVRAAARSPWCACAVNLATGRRDAGEDRPAPRATMTSSARVKPALGRWRSASCQRPPHGVRRRRRRRRVRRPARRLPRARRVAAPATGSRRVAHRRRASESSASSACAPRSRRGVAPGASGAEGDRAPPCPCPVTPATLAEAARAEHELARRASGRRAPRPRLGRPGSRRRSTLSTASTAGS